jgi:hypothetical protein
VLAFLSAFGFAAAGMPYTRPVLRAPSLELLLGPLAIFEAVLAFVALALLLLTALFLEPDLS